MPLPRLVARLNKRYTNRLIEPVARRCAGFIVVVHRGRRSDIGYRTPLVAFDRDGSLLVALTYGPSADWAQNVRSRGGAVDRRGTERRIIATSIVGRDAAWPYLPVAVRVGLRCARVHHFLLIKLGEDSGE